MRRAREGGGRAGLRSRLGLAALLLGAGTMVGGLGSPAVALAAAAADPGASVALDAECARLRAELGRVNAEITALKRGERGVRDDYRLRKRMADAEELARRLTAAEAELRRLRAPAIAGPSSPTPTPGAAPAEAPGVLEARADLLSDQARRLQAQASSFERAAGQLRTRQSLRRRAGHLDRDPFASMEGSKRFMVVPGSTAPARTGTEKAGDSSGNLSGPTQPPTTPGGAPVPAGGPGTAPAPGSPGSTTPTPTPPAMTPGTTLAPPAPTQPPPPNTTPPAPTPGTTTQPESGGGASAGGDGRTAGPSSLTPPTVAAPVAGTRAMLDPQTAAELRRIESAAGRPLDEAERLEQAAGVLARKARALEEQAKTLRARAQQR